MVLSDMTQGVRHVRALLTKDDLQRLVVQHVADHANLDVADPSVKLHTLLIEPEPRPGCHAAEVIIEVTLL